MCHVYIFIHYFVIYTAQRLALIFYMLVCVPRSHNCFGSAVQVLEGEGDGGTPWSVPENATESDLLFLSSVSYRVRLRLIVRLSVHRDHTRSVRDRADQGRGREGKGGKGRGEGTYEQVVPRAPTRKDRRDRHAATT